MRKKNHKGLAMAAAVGFAAMTVPMTVQAEEDTNGTSEEAGGVTGGETGGEAGGVTGGETGGEAGGVTGGETGGETGGNEEEITTPENGNQLDTSKEPDTLEEAQQNLNTAQEAEAAAKQNYEEAQELVDEKKAGVSDAQDALDDKKNEVDYETKEQEAQNAFDNLVDNVQDEVDTAQNAYSEADGGEAGANVVSGLASAKEKLDEAQSTLAEKDNEAGGSEGSKTVSQQIIEAEQARDEALEKYNEAEAEVEIENPDPNKEKMEQAATELETAESNMEDAETALNAAKVEKDIQTLERNVETAQEALEAALTACDEEGIKTAWNHLKEAQEALAAIVEAKATLEEAQKEYTAAEQARTEAETAKNKADKDEQSIETAVKALEAMSQIEAEMKELLEQINSSDTPDLEYDRKEEYGSLLTSYEEKNKEYQEAVLNLGVPTRELLDEETSLKDRQKYLEALKAGIDAQAKADALQSAEKALENAAAVLGKSKTETEEATGAWKAYEEAKTQCEEAYKAVFGMEARSEDGEAEANIANRLVENAQSAVAQAEETLVTCIKSVEGYDGITASTEPGDGESAVQKVARCYKVLEQAESVLERAQKELSILQEAYDGAKATYEQKKAAYTKAYNALVDLQKAQKTLEALTGVENYAEVVNALNGLKQAQQEWEAACDTLEASREALADAQSDLKQSWYDLMAAKEKLEHAKEIRQKVQDKTIQEIAGMEDIPYIDEEEFADLKGKKEAFKEALAAISSAEDTLQAAKDDYDKAVIAAYGTEDENGVGGAYGKYLKAVADTAWAQEWYGRLNPEPVRPSGPSTYEEETDVHTQSEIRQAVGLGSFVHVWDLIGKEEELPSYTANAAYGDDGGWMEAEYTFAGFLQQCEKNILALRPVRRVSPNLELTLEGSEFSIVTKTWMSFDRKIIQALSKRPDLAIKLKFLYKGKWYQVAIPAGCNLMSLLNEEGYCGFLYLYSLFGVSQSTAV